VDVIARLSRRTVAPVHRFVSGGRMARDDGVVAEGLVKRLGDRTVLDGVSLELGPGVTGLLGPNGAGKSTLLRVLATVLEPDAGRLRLLGLEPVTEDARLEVRRRLGYLPQEPGLHPGFTAAEYLDYVAIHREHHDRRARRAEVARVLAAVDLAGHAGVRVRRLSGGMRRRLALAQALVGDPALLLLDEPATGLDPQQVRRAHDLVRRLGEDRCVVLSSHDPVAAGELCGLLVVLVGGRVAFAGTPSELAALADGRVWLAQRRDPGALAAWRVGDGGHRHVGTPPPGSGRVAPTPQDGYLLLVRGSPAGPR